MSFFSCNLGKQEIVVNLALKQILYKEYMLARGELNDWKMEQKLSSGELKSPLLWFRMTT